MTRILVVEDERDLAMGIRANLEVEGYEVVVAPTGEDALELTPRLRPDLVILDLMLPGISGYDVLESLRAGGHEMPILILSARGEEVDKVRGFRAGADDYVTKPFGVMELLVRIEAKLRRRSDPAPQVTPFVGGWSVDAERRVVSRDGVQTTLTPKAVELLLALHRKAGRVASRQELLRDVWGYAADTTTRTVDVHIAELRRKLEDDPRDPQLILTVWKSGYRLRC